MVVEEGFGVVLQLVAYSATCLAHLRPVSAIISHTLIRLMVGVLPGLDHRRIGVHQDGVVAVVHLIVEAAAALAQGQLLVSKHMNIKHTNISIVLNGSENSPL